MKLLTAVLLTLVGGTVLAHEAHDHGKSQQEPLQAAAKADTVTVRGEVLDLVCYIDHNAMGAKHADCAKTCIESGLPVGLKGDDGKTYILVGEHKPLNKVLAQYAAQTITVRGKHVSRDGLHMLENVEIVK